MLDSLLEVVRPLIFLGWIGAAIGFVAACVSISDPEKNK